MEYSINCNENPTKILSLNNVIDITNDLRKVFFPGYFEEIKCSIEQYTNKVLKDVSKKLYQALLSVEVLSNETLDKDDLINKFMEGIPEIVELLKMDLNATLDGDPAALDLSEIILTYPGLYAISIYRIAHLLYKLGVKYLPRMMSEIAHGKTGIDIHPGATIGKNFFIDHGTGIVVGETTIIGNNVKIYQGVTIGALSLSRGKLLKGVKRHPTIMDNVTIYAGASILGGETVIGENTVLGSNVQILSSIPANSIVNNKSVDLEIKEKRK